MTAEQDARFRLDLANKLLVRAQDELARNNWREAAFFARGAIENAAKAIVACFGAIPRSHEPSALLTSVVDDPRFPTQLVATAQALSPRLLGYGMAEHLILSYGDERNHIDPWTLVTAQHADESVATATEILEFARTTVGAMLP